MLELWQHNGAHQSWVATHKRIQLWCHRSKPMVPGHGAGQPGSHGPDLATLLAYLVSWLGSCHQAKAYGCTG